MNIKKKIAIIILLLLSFGCQESWYLSITDLDEQLRPTFCVSTIYGCLGFGLNLDLIGIYEVNEPGEEIRPVWVISNEQNIKIKDLKYGVLPKGYEEIQPPKKLVIGKFYMVLHKYYFRIIKKDQELKTEVYTEKEYHSISNKNS